GGALRARAAGGLRRAAADADALPDRLPDRRAPPGVGGGHARPPPAGAARAPTRPPPPGAGDGCPAGHPLLGGGAPPLGRPCLRPLLGRAPRERAGARRAVVRIAVISP